MPLPTHLILRTAACLSALILSTGCSSADSRASAALGEYQAAAAANDLLGARNALLKLVRAKDDVADYWTELGKVQASRGAYGDAYYAFNRAYELDRSNAGLIRILAELALRSGDIGLAKSRARELEVVAPNDPWVKIVDGWAAMSESHFDRALAISDSILGTSSFDPIATVLKARALIGLEREPDAVDLLTKQVQAQPADSGSLELLARIYGRQNDWVKLAQTARRLTELNAANQNNMLLLVEASLRAGDIAQARRASFRLLRPNASRVLVSSVLELWAKYWPSPQRITEARRLAAAASGQEQRLAYAAFFSDAGSPADALRLASSLATLPVRAENAEANAVLADALSRSGNLGAAKARFDAVLAFDAGNATALRGRSELELRTGNAKAAIEDARKLVTVLPESSRDRLLLARAYVAAGNKPWAERTLWAAFQEIPADGSIYGALLATRKGNAEGISELQAEFIRQLDGKLKRGLL